MSKAIEVIDDIIDNDNSLLLIARAFIQQKHNGISYRMIREELVLAAMKQIANEAFNAGRDYEHAIEFGSVPTQKPSREQFITNLFGEAEPGGK